MSRLPRRADRQADQCPCPRCGQPGYLRQDTGWCGHCSRVRQSKQPPRACAGCGQVRPHAGLGLCSPCWQRHPDRPFIAGDNLIARLTEPPPWLGDLIAQLAARYSVGRACTMISGLGRLLEDEHPNYPQALLERARRPGRSMGSLARLLENYFTEHGLALPVDQAARLAEGRRRRRIDATPAPLRPAVESFAAFLLRSRERARRAGTLPRSDTTIDAVLSTVRDLARFLNNERGKQDWALADVHDIDAFLAVLPKGRARRLTIVGQFFRFAKTHKIVLVDPARGLSAKAPKGFTGQTLTLGRAAYAVSPMDHRPGGPPARGPDGNPRPTARSLQQRGPPPANRRHRFRRPDDPPWTATPPGADGPASWTILQRCLTHRETQRTNNPHVMVTKGTKAGRAPASTAYVSHVLDLCGVPPRMLRSTRLVDLVNTMDPKLVAAAFGMNPEGAMIYLADHIDDGRLPTKLWPG
ncbi:integrase [Streptosporangium lutulentum]